jgi:hypothetical protein
MHSEQCRMFAASESFVCNESLQFHSQSKYFFAQPGMAKVLTLPEKFSNLQPCALKHFVFLI